MNTSVAQPQPLKGLFALLLAIPFVRATLDAFRRPRPAPTLRSAPARRTPPEINEHNVQEYVDALSVEIRRLYAILRAADDAKAARAEQKRARRAQAILTRAASPASARRQAPVAPNPTHQAAPRPARQNQTPTTPKPRDKGSG